MCTVTGGAGSIARMAAAGTRLQRGAMYVAKASELITNTAIAVRSGIGIATTGYGMYKKYMVEKKEMGWDTAGECATILLNGITLGTATVNLANSAQTLGKMLKEDNVAGKLTDAVKSGINTVKNGGNLTSKWNGSGPAPGVLGMNRSSVSNKAINNYYPKDGGIEFVFDAETNTFVVGKPKYSQGYGSPHQKLANSIGADQGANTTLGGIFSRGINGEIYTNENSGHFGKNWTRELRKKFVETMRKYGLEVIHEEW